MGRGSARDRDFPQRGPPNLIEPASQIERVPRTRRQPPSPKQPQLTRPYFAPGGCPVPTVRVRPRFPPLIPLAAPPQSTLLRPWGAVRRTRRHCLKLKFPREPVPNSLGPTSPMGRGSAYDGGLGTPLASAIWRVGRHNLLGCEAKLRGNILISCEVIDATIRGRQRVSCFVCVH